ncbi:MAG: glutamate-1-semialdehyde-2,1-aminomutase [Deltaproteobacteria bacterium GWC2_42_51]|nr:MAG: glutamate-1-semialdehyde-2,1-aminomutase [Deltaproteobacteria bacterium GWC2_42_51]OGP39156.1 MAG: glutamate-1-semialdehyde-2,1-aminomutase [Deltaproteobacteria bacterium GWD2_42_10]OGP46494.1 MAG: glutamate-1-semialdehyde-2,1-aminomutase [Deltaproteobacteria bacterium GWF2_42_12]OGQ24125.1 MAG: glutamate-1-semialdehyde-2,1-aminomutase [Deltaproteobacteria bacterium RIFCSPHIGHO2_02_FULL_42_44]OGQ36660.1 MAG: glutamate-1-semialdehyde-2,1-aminomutase [Deltaproteobacteria bacterium RIFCSPL
MNTTNSKKLMQKARKLIPGGVNSPVRAFKAMGGNPLFIKKAKGSKIYDADGNCFIDYVGSWGPAILGHSHPKVNAALKKAVDRGTSFGAPTELEVNLAELVLEAFPTMDMVRFVNSGTEATMSAIRLARAYTKRDKIIKFEGCYHGHSDGLLVKAGSGAATLGVPDSPGVPADIARNTYAATYNDITSVEDILRNDPEGVACIIVEGVPGNMGVVLPQGGFLKTLRDLCNQYGIVLILDEVMSGFRLCYGGAQKVYDVVPDMTCLGKVIGGGLPVGAFGGKKGIMEMLSPSGPVYQAGTLSGNPLAMTAGIETLKILKGRGVYEKLDKTTKTLCEGLEEIANKKGIPVQIARAGAMFTLFFNEKPVYNYSDAKESNLERFAKYFKKMIERGIYLAPSQFEAVFVSLAHTGKDIEKTLEAAEKVFKGL